MVWRSSCGGSTKPDNQRIKAAEQEAGSHHSVLVELREKVSREPRSEPVVLYKPFVMLGNLPVTAGRVTGRLTMASNSGEFIQMKSI